MSDDPRLPVNPQTCRICGSFVKTMKRLDGTKILALSGTPHVCRSAAEIARVKEFRAKRDGFFRAPDAIDGQAALDEANNTITRLLAEVAALQEAMRLSPLGTTIYPDGLPGHNDSDTSTAAAVKVLKTLQRKHIEILHLFESAKDQMATAHEITARSTMPIQSVNSRTSELVNLGYLTDSDHRRIGPYGSPTIVFKLIKPAPLDWEPAPRKPRSKKKL